MLYSFGPSHLVQIAVSCSFINNHSDQAVFTGFRSISQEELTILSKYEPCNMQKQNDKYTMAGREIIATDWDQLEHRIILNIRLASNLHSTVGNNTPATPF